MMAFRKKFVCQIAALVTVKARVSEIQLSNKVIG